MQVVVERCCGLDVHKKSITACLIIAGRKEIRSFSTVTQELLTLADWLIESGVTHVAMESAGVYWKPLFNLLEASDLTLLLVNARHMRAVPGRKTDVKDAEWIADLLRHGLLKASFVPDKKQRELRELVRYRRKLIQQRAQVVNRVQKTLEGANIKLASVISDITGKTGLAILRAMAAGEENPEVLASLAVGTLKGKRDKLLPAVQGDLGAHQRFMLTSLLNHLDFLTLEISKLDEQVAERLERFAELITRLDTIPGIGRRGAEEIISEIGTDMTRFPSAAKLASWARMCPENHESGGKRRAESIGPGNKWLRSALVEAALGASRTKKSYLRAQYYRLAARKGRKRAAIAVAHSILVIIYHMIKSGSSYEDLGATYFQERAKNRVLTRAVQRIEQLGYRVTVEAA